VNVACLRRMVPAVVVAACVSGPWVTTDAVATELSTGGYSFSDELGGFRLLSAKGVGTAKNPIVVVEEIEEVAPVTLVIRRHSEMLRPGQEGYAPLTLVKVVVNRSIRVWAGFELELQEILKRPSTYGDGLSFNQFGAKAADVTSDSFADNNRLFEPYDRIRFERGHVDPGARAQFRVTITDPTPVSTFYLVQDPKLLSAALPAAGSLAFLPPHAAVDRHWQMPILRSRR
jgi:hypothetical protein